MMFDDEGLEYFGCGNAEMAQAEFAKRRFDVLITDISLPDMQGTVLATL
jgi:DNA-binding response OmpR family regulator